MRNKVLVSVMVCSLITCSGNLIAKERRGAEVVVQKKDGQQIKGELIAVKPSSLLLLDPQSGADVSADVTDIREIRIVKKSKALRGGGIGFLAGAVSGALWSASTEYEYNSLFPSHLGEAAFVAAILGGAGALIGAAIGALHGKDKTIQFEGKSQEEIKAVMEELRKQARITDFQ